MERYTLFVPLGDFSALSPHSHHSLVLFTSERGGKPACLRVRAGQIPDVSPLLPRSRGISLQILKEALLILFGWSWEDTRGIREISGPKKLVRSECGKPDPV